MPRFIRCDYEFCWVPRVVEQLTEYCSQLLTQREFDRAYQLCMLVESNAQLVSGLSESRLAVLGDCLREADKGRKALDSEDRRLYEAVGMDGAHRRTAAEAYLTQAPRKYMAHSVETYVKWLESPIVLNVIVLNVVGVGFPAQNNRVGTLTISNGNRALSLRNVPIGGRLDTASWNLDISVLRVGWADGSINLHTQLDLTPFERFEEQGQYEGKIVLSPNDAMSKTVPLISSRHTLADQATVTIELEVPSLRDRPTLPEWLGHP